MESLESRYAAVQDTFTKGYYYPPDLVQALMEITTELSIGLKREGVVCTYIPDREDYMQTITVTCGYFVSPGVGNVPHTFYCTVSPLSIRCKGVEVYMGTLLPKVLKGILEDTLYYGLHPCNSITP
jgi:hypothetical protein